MKVNAFGAATELFKNNIYMNESLVSVPNFEIALCLQREHILL